MAASGGYPFIAGGHSPKVGRRWTMTCRGADAPVSLDITARKGKPIGGKVSLDILYRNLVVAHGGDGKLSKGRDRQTLDWPTRAAGHPLTLQAMAESGGRIQLFLLPFKVTDGS